MGKNFKQQIYYWVHIAYIRYAPKIHSLLYYSFLYCNLFLVGHSSIIVIKGLYIMKY